MPAAPTLRIERALLRERCVRLACMDEVGRGALAGPVSVGLVVIDAHCTAAPMGVRDSKLLSAAQRAELVPRIQAWSSDFAVGHASNAEIDEFGIIAALRLAGRRALESLTASAPDLVLLDGSHNWLGGGQGDLFEDWAPPPVQMRVKADRDCAAVAAASVLAKEARDALMRQAAAAYPEYEWDRNKGYGARGHLQALRAQGPSPLHRISWRLTGVSTGDDSASDHPQESDWS